MPTSMCIDFRNVNEKTINDAYALPNSTDILDKIFLCTGFGARLLASRNRATG